MNKAIQTQHRGFEFTKLSQSSMESPGGFSFTENCANTCRGKS